jgi:hypothetical protein
VAAHANLVNLIEQDKGVLRVRLLQTLDNLARHGANVCSTVALDFSDIVQTSKAEAVVLAVIV